MIQFPKNDGVLDGRFNAFGRVWLGFLEALYLRTSAASQVVAVTTPDVGAAGPAYSQAHIQSLVAAQNETKAKLNELLAALKS